MGMTTWSPQTAQDDEKTKRSTPDFTSTSSSRNVDATLLAKKTSGNFIDSAGSIRAAKWTQASKAPSEATSSTSPQSPCTKVALVGTFSARPDTRLSRATTS